MTKTDGKPERGLDGSKWGASRLAIWAGMLSVYLVWGATYLAIRFAVETMPPFLMAGVRFLIAGSVLYAFRRLQGDAAPGRVEWRSAAVIGFFLLVGGNGGVVWAEQYVVSGVAALLVGSSPLWMVLIDAVRPAGGRKPTGRTVIGVLIGFAGIAILVGPSGISSEGSSIDPLSAGVLLLAAFSWAVGSIYNRGAKLPPSQLLGTGMEMLAGGAALLLISALAGEWGQLDLVGISAASCWGMAYLIVFGSWIGFAAYVWLLRVAPTPLVSTYAYVNPLVAITLGSLLADEPITLRILLAAAIILGSVALITTSPLRTAREKAAAVASVQAGED